VDVRLCRRTGIGFVFALAVLPRAPASSPRATAAGLFGGSDVGSDVALPALAAVLSVRAGAVDHDRDVIGTYHDRTLETTMGRL